jgi:hypothetical protein
MALPKLLGSREVADVMGWDTQKARRWLKRTEAGSQPTGHRGRVVTTPARLAAHFPEVFQEVVLGSMEAREL